MIDIIFSLLKINIVVAVCLLLIEKQFSRKENINQIAKPLDSNIFFKEILNKKFLDKTRMNFIKLGIEFNIYTVLESFLVGIVLSVVVYFIVAKIFKINSVAFILSVPCVFIVFALISYFANKKQDKLEKIMNDFFIQLKGAIKVNPDITEAFRRIQDSCLEPFKEYIADFLNEVNAGEVPEKALYKFAKKVDIKRFTLYINNLRHCSIYGGDIETLTFETQKLISEILVQKKKRRKETQSICMALYMLISIDLIIYFNFALGNVEYLNLMKNSSVGNIIVNLNFLSIWLVIWLASLVKKLDF